MTQPPVQDADRRAQVQAGLAEVRARIERARLAAGRDDEVALVVVTKTFPASDVEILADLGVADVAENRDQEARAKRLAAEAAAPGLRWHMIGQLQRNKASSVARWADVVESVDRVELVGALGRAAAAHGRRLEVLVQVSLDPVVIPGRGGADPGGRAGDRRAPWRPSRPWRCGGSWASRRSPGTRRRPSRGCRPSPVRCRGTGRRPIASRPA